MKDGKDGAVCFGNLCLHFLHSLGDISQRGESIELLSGAFIESTIYGKPSARYKPLPTIADVYTARVAAWRPLSIWSQIVNLHLSGCLRRVSPTLNHARGVIVGVVFV